MQLNATKPCGAPQIPAAARPLLSDTPPPNHTVALLEGRNRSVTRHLPLCAPRISPSVPVILGDCPILSHSLPKLVRSATSVEFPPVLGMAPHRNWLLEMSSRGMAANRGGSEPDRALPLRVISVSRESLSQLVGSLPAAQK